MATPQINIHFVGQKMHDKMGGIARFGNFTADVYPNVNLLWVTKRRIIPSVGELVTVTAMAAGPSRDVRSTSVRVHLRFSHACEAGRLPQLVP